MIEKIQTIVLSGLLLIVFTTAINAQNSEPVSWQFNLLKLSEKELEIVYTAEIQPGWFLYDPNVEIGGIKPTQFSIYLNDNITWLGQLNSLDTPLTVFDAFYGQEVEKYDIKVSFKQKIKVKEFDKSIEGKVVYMICNDQMCFPPKTVEFKMQLKH